ncbi:MAG: glycoside hydrolase family 1 protein [bacterium]|nr:glycoside hydrolase family 1 protein [bacterium]
MKQKEHYFPKDFLWGGSICSYQVEGGNLTQWSVWELENANELAKNAHKSLSWIPDWDKFSVQAKDPTNYISGKGIEHYKRYKEDIAIAKSLNHNALRFGIEWARLEPEEGVWDKKEWDHYKDYINELKSQGITPMLNIWHWTMPIWFTEKGGLEHKKNLKYFDRFVAKVCQEFDFDFIKRVLTINEPNVYSSFGYLTGEWVPNVKSPIRFIKVYWNLAQAHKRAYKIIKKAHPKVQVGVAHQLANVQPKRPHNLLDLVATKWMRYFWNWWFINRIRRHQDFVGINYYFTDYYSVGEYKGRKNIELFHRDNPLVPKNDLGWYMEPEGLYQVILRAWYHYKKPIYITENGVADADDKHRQWWIEETMLAMDRALSEGVDLRGYFHWSLLDNFEWKYGWWPQFGLVHVDHKTMKRTPRPSAVWWSKEIRQMQSPDK